MKTPKKRKPGRPVAADPKTTKIAFRLTQSQEAALEVVRRSYRPMDVSLADVARMIVLENVAEWLPERPDHPMGDS